MDTNQNDADELGRCAELAYAQLFRMQSELASVEGALTAVKSQVQHFQPLVEEQMVCSSKCCLCRYSPVLSKA